MFLLVSQLLVNWNAFLIVQYYKLTALSLIARLDNPCEFLQLENLCVEIGLGLSAVPKQQRPPGDDNIHLYAMIFLSNRYCNNFTKSITRNGEFCISSSIYRPSHILPHFLLTLSMHSMHQTDRYLIMGEKRDSILSFK